MGTFIKLVIAALVINAAAHVGAAWWRFYQFKDDTEQTIRFGGSESADALHARIVEKATNLSIPVGPDDVEVRREGMTTRAGASYTEQVEVVPNYRYPLHLTFNVEAFSLAGAAPVAR